MDKEKKQHRFLKLRWIAAELLLILAAALGGLYLYWLRGLEIINTMEVPARIDAYEVKKGMNARTISEDLMGEYVDSCILRIWVSKHPELGAVQRGRSRISGDETLSELLSDGSRKSSIPRSPSLRARPSKASSALLRNTAASARRSTASWRSRPISSSGCSALSLSF